MDDQDERENLEVEAGLRRAAARFDPMPAELRDTAVAAFGWRTIDADLAELVSDSLAEEDGLATVRGGPSGSAPAGPGGSPGPGVPRLLVFRGEGMGIELEITAAGWSHSLIGQLDPPRPALIEVRHPGGSTSVEADDLGRFAVPEVRPGPVSLRCRGRTGAADGDGDEAGRGSVVTEWISL